MAISGGVEAAQGRQGEHALAAQDVAAIAELDLSSVGSGPPGAVAPFPVGQGHGPDFFGYVLADRSVGQGRLDHFRFRGPGESGHGHPEDQQQENDVDHGGEVERERVLMERGTPHGRPRAG